MPTTVKQDDIAALVGMRAHELQEVLACLVPARRRGEQHWYWWVDIAAFLDRKQIARAQKRVREQRMKSRTSQHWVAGYPHLVAQWHPTKNGDVFPDEVSHGSKRSIWWKCSEAPDHEWRTSVSNRTNRKTGTGCPCCAGKKVSVTNCLKTRYPKLARQWHPSRNGPLTAADVIAATHRRCWWQCPADRSHVYDMTANARVNGRNCPLCAHRRVSPATSLAARSPRLAMQWHPSRNGALTTAEVSRGASTPAWWRCAKGHEWQTSPGRRRDGGGCPMCSGHQVSEDNSLAARAPLVAKQWHPSRNHPLSPHDVTAGSNRRVWWQCPAGPEHQWQAPVQERTTRGLGCPYCSGQRATRSHSLARRYPAIARQWHPSKNGATTPSDVTPRSHRSVWWKCPKGDDHQWAASVLQRTGPGQRGGCPYCIGRRLSSGNSLAARFPELAAQWHRTKNRPYTPETMLSGSGARVWWQCAQSHDHVWCARVAQRTSEGTGCPFCAGKRVAASNSLAAMYPAVARQWHPLKNGETTPETIFAGSARHVWWRCSHERSHVWRARVHQRTRLGTGCPHCARRASRGAASRRR